MAPTPTPSPRRMRLPSLITPSAVLLASEIALMLAKRSKSRDGGKDRSTLPLLWLVICLSIWAGFFLRAALPQGRLPHPQILYAIGVILLVLGLIVRWIAIIHHGDHYRRYAARTRRLILWAYTKGDDLR